MHVTIRAALASSALALLACGGPTTGPTPEQVTAAQAAITAPGILGHIKALADDSMLGRAPGGLGEQRAIAYISNQFKSIGLEPGNPDGTWYQNVELLGFNGKPTAEFHAGAKTIPMAFPTDYVAASFRREPPRSMSRIPTSSSLATASWRPNTAGTITRESTSQARRS